MELTITGLTEHEADAVQVFALSPRAKARPFTHLPGTPHWRQGFAFLSQSVRIYLPPELLQKSSPLRLQCAGRTLVATDLSTLTTTWRPVPKPADHPSPLVAYDSPQGLPTFLGVLNGPDLASYGEILGKALVLFLLGGAAIAVSERHLTGRSRGLRLLWLCLAPRAPLPQTHHTERRFALVGLVVLLLGLVVLVHGKRYGFVHDDNLTQFFPVILQGAESLFDQGVFPTYNPYQLMGSPTATIGTYALTYPPTYVAYALARWLLRDPYLTLDVFVVLHLTLGYLATFALARRVGLRPSLALAAALSFILCGYFCVYTRCWFYMAPVALWTPLLFLHLTELTQVPRLTWRWVGRAGIVVGLYFHAGNAQMWSYTLLLAATLVVLWQRTGRLSAGRLLWAGAALLVGLALAAPLLIPQAAEVAALDREGNIKSGITRGLLALLLPAPLATAPHPTIELGMPVVWKHLYDFGPLYFCGPLLLGAGLVALATVPVLCWGKRQVGANVWLLCGALALVLSLGENGGLAQLLVVLPGFNKFQHWWKFLPFLALCFALGGGLVLERWLRVTRRGRRAEGTILGLTCGLLLYNAALSQPVMTVPEQPYPTLAPDVRALVHNPQEPLARGAALSPWLPEWREPGFIGSLSQNFATLYELPMLEGYDPLVAKTPLNQRLTDRFYASTTVKRARQDFDPIPAVEPLTPLRRYGVRWAFLTEGREELKGIYAFNQALQENTALRHATPHTQLRELTGYDPLAFDEGHPERALVLTPTAEGVAVALEREHTGEIIVNFLAREWLHAYVDGKRVPSTKDSWDRVRVAVPAGAQTLTLRYEPAWGKGFLASAILLLVALGAVRAAVKIAGSQDEMVVKEPCRRPPVSPSMSPRPIRSRH